MSRSIEDRLVAALEARAELVTPEDLGPIVVPDRPRRIHRGAVLLLAAAASVAVVATPFVLAGGGVSPDPAGPPSVGVPEPTGSTTPSESPTEPGEVVPAGRQRADVDGDGWPDTVRLLHHGATVEEPATGSVEVSLAGGGTGVATVPFGYPPNLLPPHDLDGDGREQVLLSHTAGGDEAQLLVYTWHEGTLVRARTDGDAPLALGLDGQGRVTGYYVDERGLFSWQRLDPVEAGGPVYRVEQWSWSLEGDRLVPAPAGAGCVDVTSEEPPGACPGS